MIVMLFRIVCIIVVLGGVYGLICVCFIVSDFWEDFIGFFEEEELGELMV